MDDLHAPISEMTDGGFGAKPGAPSGGTRRQRGLRALAELGVALCTRGESDSATAVTVRHVVRSWDWPYGAFWELRDSGRCVCSTTTGIGQSVAEAARGTAHSAENLSRVAHAAQETTRAAVEAVRAVGSLTGMSESLQETIETFQY